MPQPKNAVTKVAGFCNVPGAAWSNPYQRIQDDATPAKIRAALQDQLIARGRLALLYLPVNIATPGSVACTCTKATTRTADRPCFSCYGSKRAPGYTRFLHETIFWSAAEASGWTLTNTVIETELKPQRVGLATGALSGTVVTPDKPYAAGGVAAAAVAWDSRVDFARRSVGSDVTTEFSTDGGTTYHPLAEINGGYKPTGAGTLRLRHTLTRASVDDEGPALEVARVRRPQPERVNPAVTGMRPDYTPGSILLLRTWVVQQPSLDQRLGKENNHLQDRGWTSGLAFYDSTITLDTPAERIDSLSDASANDGMNVHPMYQNVHGAMSDQRYLMTNLDYSMELGMLTSQSWVDRRVQEGESGWLVW